MQDRGPIILATNHEIPLSVLVLVTGISGGVSYVYWKLLDMLFILESINWTLKSGMVIEGGWSTLSET